MCILGAQLRHYVLCKSEIFLKGYNSNMFSICQIDQEDSHNATYTYQLSRVSIKLFEKQALLFTFWNDIQCGLNNIVSICIANHE